MALAIFDLDGTLIDSKLDLAHAVNATRRHMGMSELEHERVYSYVGNGAPVLIRRALGEEASEPQVQEALEFFLEYYHEHYLDFTVLYPGVREGLIWGFLTTLLGVPAPVASTTAILSRACTMLGEGIWAALATRM